jgi:dynein heavy chain
MEQIEESVLEDPEAMSSQYDQLLAWLEKRLTLLGYPPDSWAPGMGNSVLVEFVSGLGPKTLSVVSTEDGIVFSVDSMDKDAKSSSLVAYFLRNSSVHLKKENLTKEMQYGTIGGKGLSLITFERIMKGLVEKQVAQNNELTGHYHRCMATLTDTVHFSDGRTVLYCPTFEFTSVPEAAQDKERLQIMESIVIHWTRQIKDVVNNHDSSASAETSGPLDEIEFWKGRAQDLIGIQKQLEGEKVCKLIEVLQYAKSNYIGPFQTLTKQIVERAAESNDNLKFLESIRAQCTALRQIEPEKIVTILPDLLNRIRLIWSLSTFYNENEHVSGILRKISNEIIRRFRTHVSISEILNGDVEFSITRLKEAIHCGMQWKVMYHKTLQSIEKQKARYGSSWDIDDASIFAQIDAFVQRCRDLIEVCESQMQFVRKSAKTKGSPGPIPHFGGTKAQEIVDGIAGIQESFEHHVDRLRKLDYDVLDVKVSRWHDDYSHFKNDVKDLEVMFTNVINAAFEHNVTVSEGVILTETFYHLAKRETIMRCVERKAAETNHMFLKQVIFCIPFCVSLPALTWTCVCCARCSRSAVSSSCRAWPRRCACTSRSSPGPRCGRTAWLCWRKGASIAWCASSMFSRSGSSRSRGRPSPR